MNLKQTRKIVDWLDAELKHAQMLAANGKDDEVADSVVEAERHLTALCTAMGFYAPKKIERDERPPRALLRARWIGGDA